MTFTARLNPEKGETFWEIVKGEDVVGVFIDVPESNTTPQEVASRWKVAQDSIAVAPPGIRPAHVYAERDRRLSLGFEYDFGDERGVHKIGTTEADMRGWNEVTTAFDAADKLSIELTLTIMTETGPAQVNSAEWASILLQSATVRQAIWAASFALQEADQIPEDYTNDIYWGGGE